MVAEPPCAKESARHTIGHSADPACHRVLKGGPGPLHPHTTRALFAMRWAELLVTISAATASAC